MEEPMYRRATRKPIEYNFGPNDLSLNHPSTQTGADP